MPYRDTEERKAYHKRKSREYYLANREKLLAQNKTNKPKWHAANPEKVKAYSKKACAIAREKKTGFTQELFDQRFAAQNGKCAVCGCELKLVADHNHDTGQPRGLLCNRCNPMIGFAKDNPETLRRAAEYIERWNKA